MKKSVNVVLIFALLLVTAAAISGCAQYGQQAGQQSQPPAPPSPPAVQEQEQQQAPPSPPSPQEPEEQEQAAAAASEKTVEITATGFSPETLMVKAGDTVVFVNKDTAQHWLASAVHPTHAVYPEPGGCIGSKFDACKGLAQGESFTFVFNQKGSWKYHDHLNPSLWGTVVVE